MNTPSPDIGTTEGILQTNSQGRDVMPLVIGEAILDEYVGPSRRVDAPKILAHTVRTRRRHESLSAAPPSIGV